MPNLRERARRVAGDLLIRSFSERCRAESRIEQELISLVRECIVQVDGNGLAARRAPEAVKALQRLLVYAPQRDIRVAKPVSKEAHEE
jgi:hypothetical protein